MSIQSSLRREAIGFALAATVAAVATAFLWQFTLARWVGLVVVLLALAMVVNRLWVRMRVQVFDQVLMLGHPAWKHTLVVTVQLPKGSPELDIDEACDDLVHNLLLDTELGNYDVASDLVRREDKVRFYANSRELLDEVAAAFLSQIDRPEATVSIEQR